MGYLRRDKEKLVGIILAELRKYAEPDVTLTKAPLRNMKLYELEAVKTLMSEKRRVSRGVEKPEKERVGKGIFPKRGDYKERLMAYIGRWENTLPSSYVMSCAVLEPLANYLEANG
jgi:hypothetical protein